MSRKTKRTFSQTKGLVWISLTILTILLLVLGLNFSKARFELRGEAKFDQARDITLELLNRQKTRDFVNLNAVAGERKQLMHQLIVENPKEALMIALGKTQRDSFPDEHRQNIEEEVTLEGTLEEDISDNFETGKSKSYYRLKTPTTLINLYFANDEPAGLNGSLVKVHGYRLDNHMAVNSGNSSDFQIIKNPSVLGANTTVNKKVAVILFNFSNDTRRPYTIDQVRNSYFTGTKSVKAFFKESSFNQIQISGYLRTDGDVYGWYTVPFTNSDCNYTVWSDNAKQQAIAHGLVENNYTNISFGWPNNPNCDWGGMGQGLGGKYTWLNGYFGLDSVGLISHEFGHNLGARHANSYVCVNSSGVKVSISNNCRVEQEYGDHFDVMGGSSRHMSDFHKGRLGWFAPSNTRIVTANGTYSLVPSELNTSAVQSLRIPRSYDGGGNVTKYYQLDYRQPYGLFDDFALTEPVVRGVTLRLASPYNQSAPSWLIDTTPSTTSFDDATLLTGRTFTDNIAGIAIGVPSISATQANVNITFNTPPCVLANPSVSVNPLGQWGNPGQNLSYNLTIINNNNASCPASTFNVSPTLPDSGWLQPNQTVTLNSGATGNLTVTVTSPTNATSGYYVITENVVNSLNSANTTSVNFNYNVNAPVTPTPTPTRSPSPTPTPRPTIISATPTPIVADTNVPQITIVEPANGLIVNNKGNLKILVNTADANGIASIQIKLDNNIIKTCSLNLTCNVNVNLRSFATGNHSIFATAMDNSSNHNSASAQVNFTIIN